MCPACIATATLVVAGAGWAGVTALVVKAPARRRAREGTNGAAFPPAHKE